MKSKQPTLPVLAALLIGVMASPLIANATPASAVSYSHAKDASTVVSVVGEIVAVNAKERTVAIKGPRGNIAEMAVDPAVRNLDKVKVGDRVRLSYRLGIALVLMKGGDGIREKVETTAADVAGRGAKPGGAVMKRTTLVANVESVNRKQKTVTLLGPDNHLLEIEVHDPSLLHDIKAGDQVAANITESIALSMRPAPK